MKTLTQIGNRYVLIDGETKKPFKDAHDLCNHINSFNLKLEIKGLQILPKYFQERIGYVAPVLLNAHVFQLTLL
jgi:hypothetical protein